MRYWLSMLAVFAAIGTVSKGIDSISSTPRHPAPASADMPNWIWTPPKPATVKVQDMRSNMADATYPISPAPSSSSSSSNSADRQAQSLQFAQQRQDQALAFAQQRQNQTLQFAQQRAAQSQAAQQQSAQARATSSAPRQSFTQAQTYRPAPQTFRATPTPTYSTGH